MTSLHPPARIAAEARSPACGAAQPRFSFVRPHDLSEPELQAWRRFQRSDPALASPYLCPDFVRIAAAVRPDVTVAIASVGGSPVGFLPFERRGGVGAPVGRAVCDCQAVVAAPGWNGDPRAFVRAAGLSVFDFTALRASQAAFAPFHRSVEMSHVIDLSAGFEAYVRDRRAFASNRPKTSFGYPHQALARMTLLERQVGALRFRMHEPDPAALRQLLDWKSAQYRRSGLPDAFARPWLVTLLERIQSTRTPDFAGVMSTLSAGGRVVAVHMGMRSATVLHYWYPAYDASLAKFSPGLVLLTEICRHAAQEGIGEIELGVGSEPYKLHFANAGRPVAAGFVGSFSLPALIRAGRHGVEAAAARLPLGPLARWPGRLFRRLDLIGRFR